MGILDSIGAWAFTVFGVICGVAGLAALVYGLKTFVQENRNCTYRTTGRVIETLYDYDTVGKDDPSRITGNDALCALRLEVELYDEKLEVFNDQYSSSYCKYDVGDIVPVRINPGNPNEYVITDGSASPGLFMLLLGAGMLAACWYIIKIFRF